MVLPLTLFTLVVLGALVACGFALALLEQRAGRNVLYAVQAAGAAESGAAATLGRWDALGLGSLPVGASTALPGAALPGPAVYAPSVTRLNAELYLIRVGGTRLDAGGGLLARRVLSAVVKAPDSVPPGSSPVVPLTHRAWDWPFGDAP